MTTWLRNRRRLLGRLLGLAVLILPLAAGPARAEQPVLVFAAASLKNALDAAVAGFTQATGSEVKVSYAASSALAKQIEQAAPAQIFISADLDWMDYLAERHLIQPESRFNLLGNDLVLVAGKAGAAQVEIKPGFDLAALLGTSRLAVGQVDSVPAGRYAKAALQNLGAWDGVAGKLAQSDNVRAALALVAQGEAAYGIVYATDAVAEPRVEVVGKFPADSHPPIIYPAALLKDATPAAGKLLDYLRTAPTAKAAFKEQGFAFLGAPAS